MDIDNFRKVCIVGWAKSGASACNLLLSLNKKVLVTEEKNSSFFDSNQINAYKRLGVEFEFGGHSHDFMKESQLVILSPGVDTVSSQPVKIANELGILSVGEIEFSSWFTQAKIIAITGTNGKTTTAQLTYEVLKPSRKRLFLGGNIGTPFSSFVLDTKKRDLIILEVSSFQLETILEFKPYVATLLNITPDHLDRHPNLQAYFKTKANIFKNQDEGDWAVINKNVNSRKKIEEKIKSKKVYFSNEFSNENFSCVYRVASIFGLGKADCLSVFVNFKGFSHRLQFTKELRGITFINDSKATNPSSTIWALQNIKTPVILLAGGKDKGLDYASVTPFMKKVKRINLFGEASEKIKKALNSNIEAEIFPSFKEAILTSYRQAESGDTVLLSPMCSSFDMFSDYQHRGNSFMEIVNSLKA